MASFNLTDISSALSGMMDEGVSFVGKALKFNNAADVAELIEAIKKCPKLICLNLEGNSLGVEAAKCIGEALKTHPELERALFKDLFTGRMKDEIPVALEAMGEGMRFAHAKLTVFDCSDNALGPNGMKGLVELFRSSTCYSLQELRLNNCGLGIQGAKMLAQSLLGCHTKSVQAGTPFALKVFIAGRNRLENEGAKALAEVFAAIKSLEHLSIPQNGIYYPGITALSNALKENPNLSILNFNDNTIGPKGALALSEALYSVQKLREINFGDCLLKTRGAVLLADAIQDTHLELEVLNLEHNEIGPHGGLSLASAMYNKANLQSFNVNGNQFGEEGRLQITEILSEFDKVKVLEAMDEDESESENGEEEQGDEEEEYDEDGEEEEDDEDDDDDNDDEDDDEDENEIDESELVIEVKKPLFAGNDTTLENSLNFSVKDEVAPSNAIEAFCTTDFPSESLFNSIEDSDKVAAFRNFLENDVVASDYFICLVFAILKCSELSVKSKDALTLAEALYKDAFEYAKNNNRLKTLRNFILIQLGLLKCEDKTFKPKYNIQACRYALQQAIAHNSIPKDEQNTFQVFMDQVNGK